MRITWNSGPALATLFESTAEASGGVWGFTSTLQRRRGREESPESRAIADLAVIGKADSWPSVRNENSCWLAVIRRFPSLKPAQARATAVHETQFKCRDLSRCRAQDFGWRLGRRQLASACQPHTRRVILHKLLEGQDLEIGVHQLKC